MGIARSSVYPSHGSVYSVEIQYPKPIPPGRAGAYHLVASYRRVARHPPTTTDIVLGRRTVSANRMKNAMKSNAMNRGRGIPRICITSRNGGTKRHAGHNVRSVRLCFPPLTGFPKTVTYNQNVCNVSTVHVRRTTRRGFHSVGRHTPPRERLCRSPF